MRIRAIRLANVGRFSDPVAIEKLSGGLDVLSAPNEAGKSTVFRAIEALFLEKHTVGGKVLEALRPRVGGEPLIEAEFEARGRAWRITKQYGRGKRAELHEQPSGKLVARGADAEERLAELIGLKNGMAGGLGLLWVSQRGLLAPVTPDCRPDGKERLRGEADALHAAIEREIEIAAGGGRARAVREKVAQALDKLVQPKRRNPRAGSPYEKAVATAGQLQRQLAVARDAAQQSERRLQELAECRERAARLPEEIALAETAARGAEEAWEQGQRLAEQARTARASLDGSVRKREQAQTALSNFDSLLQERGEIAQRAAEDAEIHSALEQELAKADEALAASKAMGTALAEAEADTFQRLRARERQDRRLAAGERLEHASRTLAAARKLEHEIAVAREALDRNRVTEPAAALIDAAEREVSLLQGRIAACAPLVIVAHAAGSIGRIKANGATLAGDIELNPSSSLKLEIEGVGSIVIAPAAGSDHETNASALQSAQAQLAAALADVGANDVAGVRDRLAARRLSERALADSAARLSVLAPDGVSALAEEVERLQLLIAQSEGVASDLPPRSAIETELDKIRSELETERGRYSELREGRNRIAERLAEALATRKSRVDRMTQIEAVLPAAAVRVEERKRLAQELDAARREAAEADERVRTLSLSAPDATAVGELQKRRFESREALSRLSSDATTLKEQVARLEGAQGEADEAGLASAIPALEAELERTTSLIASYQAEVDELELLAEVLAHAENATRDRFLAPVTQRLAPYLALAFPQAHLALGQDFSVTAMERSGIAEAIGSLSDGTQEQIAVLIRLAFGRLLAETGTAVPLILDDSLVYADDDRLQRMFDSLELAAKSHQVIVLTCRRESFRRLQGTRVNIEPWRQALAAAAY